MKPPSVCGDTIYRNRLATDKIPPKENPMLTRRDVLIGAIAAGATMHLRTGFAKASQPATPVNFDVPAGACDCHTHIHGDPEKFPFFPGRVYTPETALPEEMAALHRALRLQRVVIVTPSVYGTDNSATLWGMAARGADARGVAVIDDKTRESERSEEHTSELQSQSNLVCRLLLEKKNNRSSSDDGANTSLASEILH